MLIALLFPGEATDQNANDQRRVLNQITSYPQLSTANCFFDFR
jgi:hypothetical protein